MEDVLALSIPIVLVLAVAAVAGLRLRYRHLDRVAAQATIQGAIERGQALTPELVAHLTELDTGRGDLRRGAISIAISLAIVVFAVAIGEQDAVRPLAGIAAFPLLVGLAYLGLYRFARPRAGKPV